MHLKTFAHRKGLEPSADDHYQKLTPLKATMSSLKCLRNQHSTRNSSFVSRSVRVRTLSVLGSMSTPFDTRRTLKSAKCFCLRCLSLQTAAEANLCCPFEPRPTPLHCLQTRVRARSCHSGSHYHHHRNFCFKQSQDCACKEFQRASSA